MIIPDAPPLAEMAEGAPTVPEATYNLRVHKSEYIAVPKRKESKGPYLKIQHVITGPGDSKAVGRMVFQNYTLTGDGSFRLRELLTVTNHPSDFKLEDDQQLVGLEFAAAVIVKPGTAEYPNDKNEIKKHMPLLKQ